MDSLLDLFMAALCASTALAAVWGWWAAKNRELKQALRNAKLVPISKYPNGKRKRIVGELSLLDEALIAPLSGRQCAVYVVVVERPGGGSGVGGSMGADGMGTGGPVVPETPAYEMRCASFVIRDQTRRAIVHPEHARVALTMVEHSTSSWSDDPTSPEQALLRRLAKEELGDLINERLRFREGVIEPGAVVAVLGHGVVSLDEAPDGPNEHHGGYRAPAGQTKVTVTGSSRAPVLISDDPSVLRGVAAVGVAGNVEP